MATTRSTRRSFISTAGAALSAPLAAGAVIVPLGAAESSHPNAARLAELEDQQAIQALNQAFAKHLNAGEREAMAALFAEATNLAQEISGITTEGLGEFDRLEVAVDRQTASARVRCTLHTETEIGPSCPLVEMARLQGGGVVKDARAASLEFTYVRSGDRWSIEHLVISEAPQG